MAKAERKKIKVNNKTGHLQVALDDKKHEYAWRAIDVLRKDGSKRFTLHEMLRADDLENGRYGKRASIIELESHAKGKTFILYTANRTVVVEDQDAEIDYLRGMLEALYITEIDLRYSYI